MPANVSSHTHRCEINNDLLILFGSFSCFERMLCRWSLRGSGKPVCLPCRPARDRSLTLPALGSRHAAAHLGDDA